MNPDIVIVGNGIIALSIAFRLATAHRQIKVTVIGDPARQGSATLAAGAMISAWGEMIRGYEGNAALLAKFELAKAGLDLWPEYARELSDVSGQPIAVGRKTILVQTGRSTEPEVRAVSELLATLRQGSVSTADSSIARDCLMPQIGNAIHQLVELPDLFVEPHAVVAALESALTRLAIPLIPARVLSCENLDCDGPKHIKLDTGRVITCSHIVLANGVGVQALIEPYPELTQAIPRLLHGSGMALQVQLPEWLLESPAAKKLLKLDSVIRTHDRGGACGLHLVPRFEGKYYVGSTSVVLVKPETFPRASGVQFLLNGLISEFNQLFSHGAVQIIGPGQRPTTSDTYPLIGALPHCRGTWLATGTKRDGITMAPRIAELVVGGILEGEPPKHEFAPCRELISFFDKPEAVQRTLEMYEMSDYTGGTVIGSHARSSYFEIRRLQTERVYERRKIERFGIHPELIHLYEGDDTFDLIYRGRRFD